MASNNITRRSFIGAAGIAASTLAACGGAGDAGEGGGNTAAGKVYWLNFKPELDETLQTIKDMYKEAKGIEPKIVTAASGTYSQTLTSEMDKTDAPTMFVIGNAAGVKEWGDFALDLKGTAIESELNTDAYNLYDESGKLVSMGYCYECYGIVANADLIAKAGHDIADIKDFASLEAVVTDIHSRASELGFDAFVATDMDDSSSWRVTGHLANLDYFYEERDDGGWDECPATIKGTYVENYKKLYDLAINNSTVEPKTLATGGHDPAQQFKDGKACFFFTGSWDYADLAAAQPNIHMLPYYCGVDGEEKAGLNCGTENCWAVNANASEADQQATIDFMVWLVTDPDASALLVEQLGIMPYNNAAESTNGFLNDAADYTSNGCYVMDWATNYQPNVDDYRAALVSALNAYNANPSDKTWADVRTAFVDGWATQYKKANA